MRITLDIDDDILDAARELAARKRSSLGEVVSDLIRAALRRDAETTINRNGITVFARRGVAQPVTLDVVNRLRDESP
jgi:hypothetical protein